MESALTAAHSEREQTITAHHVAKVNGGVSNLPAKKKKLFKRVQKCGWQLDERGTDTIDLSLPHQMNTKLCSVEIGREK